MGMKARIVSGVAVVVVVAAAVETTFKGHHLSSVTSFGSENESVISGQMVERKGLRR